MKKGTLFLMLLLFAFLISGCGNNDNTTRLESRIASLENEIALLKDTNSTLMKQYSLIDDLNSSINTLEEKYKEIEAKIPSEDDHSSVSLVSLIVQDNDAIALIDFNKDVGEISFLVFKGEIKNQSLSMDYLVDVYDQVINPGIGVIGTDDVPESVKRYQITFPATEEDVVCIFAFEKSTDRFWRFDRVLKVSDI